MRSRLNAAQRADIERYVQDYKQRAVAGVWHDLASACEVALAEIKVLRAKLRNVNQGDVLRARREQNRVHR